MSQLPVFVQIIRWIHISSGFAAFFIAPVALLTVKGGPAHRRWGKIYLWAMVVSTLTALVVALYRPVYFLAAVSVFSFYLAFRGYRVLRRKRPDLGERAKTLDWTVTLLTLAGSLMLVVLGILRPGGMWITLGPAAVAFGILGIWLTAMDIREFLYPPRDRHSWWYSHMAGMVGSYIAAVTAFSVNNFRFLPPLARWLGPVLIGVPLLVFWIRSYVRKFSS